MKTRLLLIFALFSSAFSFAQTVTTVTGSTSGDAIGDPSTARFYGPNGITNDGGNVYVTDSNNHKIKKIYSDNSTVSFVGSTEGFVNGTGAAARFSYPNGIVRIAFNDFLVCDSGNNAIRKITSSGVVTTFAGGTDGNTDATGTSAQFSYPFGIAVDASDNVYVTDYSNKRIRKITPAGVVTTLAGSTTGFTDGTGTAAQFNSPTGIAVDASGNVFVVDNNGRAIRKITPSGVVTTFAGGNTNGYVDGNGTAAQFNGINGLSFDGAGNLIVLDTYNYRIRKISPTGDVSTFAGSGVEGNADGDAGTASFYSITSVTKMMTSENLYITDNNSHRIRKIVPGTPVTAPTISGVSATAITATSADINYSLNANNGASTSIVKYGLTSGNLSSQVTGFTASGNTVSPGTVTLSGLLPSTTYYYQIEATNIAGIGTSVIGNFTTFPAPPVAGSPIAEYNFNNTYNNIYGNLPFGWSAGTSFVTGRDGVTASGALNIYNSGSIGVIPGLPYGNAARTVSLWVKTNVMNSGYNMIFSYGQGSASNAFGASYNASVCEMFGYANNLSINSTNANNTWYHFVYVYDGTNAKIYKNGVLLTTNAKTWNTTNNSNYFKLGIGVGNEYNLFDGAIDDLKIYDYAVTDAQVLNLYNNNTALSSENFNQNNLEVALYPNPANDVLNIEMTNEVKSIEIYNIQGQKVKVASQKQINVSDLAAGMYMVRIQDTDNAIATKKIIIK